MLDIRDPAIKLFGTTIPVVGDGEESSVDMDNSNSSDQQENEKDLVEEESMETQDSNDASPPVKESSEDRPPSTEANTDSEKDTESPHDEKDSNGSSKKPIKKPDKILPCPRCNSMDTKFCYYNNYNVNQPRHFCKSCQRYWTAGGSMRNVPVGAGRRKNKSSTSKYCQITVSEALQAAQQHNPSLKSNGTVLTFGPENPLCDSMASALNLAEKRNGFHTPLQSRENDDHSSASTITTSSKDEGMKTGQNTQNSNGYPPQMPCFQWPYMWNPAIPVPTYCPSGMPMSFYPAPYWNGAIPWNIPWNHIPGSNPNSLTLGKHSRDGKMIKPNDPEKSSGGTTVLVPKTLRIDDPDDAAKSSIWTTLGINKEKGDSITKGGGFFNSFQTKGDEKDKKIEASSPLKANPAALCRSISFQENASRCN